MMSEMKEGTLFYSTVARCPFEVERTRTEVIVRHGGERERPALSGRKGRARGQFVGRGIRLTRPHSSSWPCSPQYSSSPLSHHSPVSSPSRPSCSLYLISTHNGKVMLRTRCHTSLSYLAQVCSIHGRSSPPSLLRRPYLRSVSTYTLSRTT